MNTIEICEQAEIIKPNSTISWKEGFVDGAEWMQKKIKSGDDRSENIREGMLKEYLNHENNNYYNGIELLYATATPKERVRIEDNRICLENAIKEIERLESENAALRQQVKDMGEVIKELKASDEYHKVARYPSR